MGKETWQVLYGLQTIILIIMAAFTVTNHTQMANEPSRSRRSLDIADLASQFDEVQSTLEGFMQKARRSNEDQIQSLSDALYEEIRSLQVAVDEVDFKTVEVLKSKQGPPGPAGYDGVDGARGPRGYKGEPGSAGARGSTGRAGNDGPRGADGYCTVWDKIKGDVSVPCPEMQDSANAKEVYNLKGVVEAIGRQIVVSEMAKEQRVRYEGASGLTQTRGYQGGDKAYHEASYTNVGFANFHNHANTKHTVGMGEVAVVLNGVEFWTRHNDYNLVMPDPADPGTYHSNKYITHPPVPGEVEAYESVEDQAEEMRRWFHAWQDEDPKCPSCVAVDDERESNGLGRFDEPNTERYYPEFFKPVLCVMEGAWIKQSLDFEESFESDRHFVDAKDWRELYDKNRFLYQSGRKSTQENLPFLPLSVRGLEGTTANETTPAFANWEYRIICTPLKEYVPLYNFRVSSDLAIQLGATSNDMLTLEELSDSRRARFDLNHKNQTSWVEGKFSFGLIDDLMYQVPGKDGYSANLRDDAFGAVATEIESDADGNKPELNTAFYTRYYSIGTKDAMGRSQHRRGFNDPTLWAAMTTHDKIQGVTSCTAELINGAGGECTEDVIKSQKWTWAVPLEIIYTTPLGQWNPYNLEYCVEGKDSSKCKTSKGPKGVRTGALSVDYAFDGVARDAWFVTPEEFFSGTNEEVDVADTSGGVTGVLDPAGVLRKTRAAGHWVHWPAIKGFDKPVRQRFPIMPIHEHGKTSWKEVKALQDLVVDAGGSAKMRANLDKVREERLGVALTLAYTTGGTTGVGPHTHSLHISGEQTALLNKGESVTVSTSLDNGHTHDVTVARDQVIFRDGYPEYTYKLMQCDRMAVCGDPEARAAHETALAEAVSKHEPWGVYTNAAENFKSVRGGDFAFWNDTSGNGHHTIKITTPIRNEKARKACQLHDAPPATAAVLCGREQGLVFPNGSIPAEFTIFSRAQFAKDTVDVPLYQRYITRDANDKRWYGGFSGYGVGRTVLANGKTPTTQCAVSKEDAKGAYNVVANRNVRDNSQYVTFVNSEPMAIRNDWWGTTAAAEESQLAIGAIWESASQKDYGSDFLITDLLIFDKHLDDAAIKEISDLLQQQGVVERPQPCCWDGHKTVQVSR